MKNKIAVVIGGTGEIGTEICRHLCTHGAMVIAVDDNEHDHHLTKIWQKEQRAHGYGIDIKNINMLNTEACASAVKELEDEYGEIDILINNTAAICEIGPVADRIFNLTHHILNGMSKRFYGRIINITPPITQQDQGDQITHQFTTYLSQEVAHRGITVNTVSPGYIETDTMLALPENIRDAIVTQVPVKRLGRPEEVARVVGFLAAQASSFMTGINIPVNGGQHDSRRVKPFPLVGAISGHSTV